MSVGNHQREQQTRWEITRLELVYFNLRHKRWQIWQEHPTGDTPLNLGETHTDAAPLYRRQFHRLLDILRTVLASQLSETHATRLFSVAPLNSDADIDFELKPDSYLASHSNPWHLFIDECLRSAQEHHTYSAALAGFLLAIKNHDMRGQLRDGAPPLKKLPRGDALNLISLLPILAPWDLYGCWWQAWERHAEPKKRDAFSFPPVPADAHRWREPLYMARLLDCEAFPDDNISRPLDERLETEVICCDAASGNHPIYFPARHFFDEMYCEVPDEGNLPQYRAYAYIYDGLQQGLSTASGGVKRSDEAQYVISFPISCLGRIHFLQLQVIATGQGSKNLRDLWQDWWASIHSSFWTQDLKHFLSEELQRIGIMTMQTNWYWQLQEQLRKENQGEDPHRKMIETLCSNAYSMIPLRGLGYGNSVWQYTASRLGRSEGQQALGQKKVAAAQGAGGDTSVCRPELEAPKTAKYGELGVEWTRVDGASLPAGNSFSIPSVINGRTSDLTVVISDDAGTDIDQVGAILGQGRCKQLFEQQFVFGEQMLNSLLQEKDHSEKRARRARQRLREYFAQPMVVQTLAQQGTLEERQLTYQAAALNVDESIFGSASATAFELMEIGYPDPMARGEFERQASQPTLPWLVSEILEVGPFKAATHSGEIYWDGSQSLDEHLAATRTRWQGHQEQYITTVTSRRLKQFLNRLDAVLEDLAKDAVAAKRAQRPASKLGDRYRALRNPLPDPPRTLGPRWNTGHWPGDEEFRTYCPLLAGVFPLGELGRSAVKRMQPNTNGVIHRCAWDIAQIPFEGTPWKQLKIVLCRNILCFQYSIQEMPSPGKLHGAKIWGTLRKTAPPLRKFARLIVAYHNGSSAEVVDLTDEGDSPPQVPVESLLKSAPDKVADLFKLSERQILVALVFDTWKAP